MKTEKEIKELKKKLEDINNNEELAAFVDLTEKGGHWIDCLDWVLKE